MDMEPPDPDEPELPPQPEFPAFEGELLAPPEAEAPLQPNADTTTAQ
jgi:hypothetical protein